MTHYVTETDVRSFLPPEHSFVTQYVWHGASITDAALAYHYAMAHILLGVAAPIELHIDALPGGRVYANFWTLLVGQPAVGHKSTCVRIGRLLLEEALPNRALTTFGSVEGAQRDISRRSQVACLISEFGEFLASAESGYAAKLKPFLTGQFDCEPIDKRLSKDHIRQATPRMSFAGAVNEGFLFHYTRDVDWDGGFMSRFFMMNARVEREDPDGTPDPGRTEWLIATLRTLASAKVGICTGLDPDAWEHWRTWERAHRERIKADTEDSHVAAGGRTPTYAAKLALLQSFDYGPACHGEEWTIPLDILVRATEAADCHYLASLDLARRSYRSDDMRDMDHVLKILAGGSWTAYPEIVRRSGMSRNKLDQVLDTLLAGNRVRDGRIGGKTHYRVNAMPEADEEEDPLPDVGVSKVLHLGDHLRGGANAGAPRPGQGPKGPKA